MKKVALISTFCDTQEKIDVLKSSLLKLTELGIDSLIITPIELPQEVIQMSTYCFFTKENPILKWPEYCRVVSSVISENGKSFKVNMGLSYYGFAAAWQIKKLSQLALTYEYDRFYVLVYDVLFDETLINALRSDDHTCTVWPVIRGTYYSRASLHFMAFDRENLAKLAESISREQYVSTMVQNPAETTEGWFVKLCEEKVNPSFAEDPVTDLISYYQDADHFDIAKMKAAKVFVQKCNENGFDVRLLIYAYQGEKKIIIRTNLGDHEFEGQSPYEVTIANGTDFGLSSVVIQIDGYEKEIIDQIREVGLAYFEIW